MSMVPSFAPCQPPSSPSFSPYSTTRHLPGSFPWIMREARTVAVTGTSRIFQSGRALPAENARTADFGNRFHRQETGKPCASGIRNSWLRDFNCFEGAGEVRGRCVLETGDET